MRNLFIFILFLAIIFCSRGISVYAEESTFKDADHFIPRAESKDERDAKAYEEPVRAEKKAQSLTDLALPSTIKVARTGYLHCSNWLNAGQPVDRVETIAFKDYVKNVLPNEWISSWPEDSLKAGAMAAKVYGWRKIAVGGRHYLQDMHNLSEAPDVVDNTCDQVYISNSAKTTTNEAVDETWDYIMTKDGEILRLFYLATEDQCTNSPYQPCMPQWGTERLAREGKNWQHILHTYYDPMEITLTYLPDVPPGHVFYEFIKNLVDANIVSGYPDGYFRPQEVVTRGAMAKFIKNAYGFADSLFCGNFPDVPTSHTFYKEITTLKCNGVVSGYADGTFKPEEQVDRGAAMKFVIEGLRKKNNNSNYLRYTGTEQRFSDVQTTNIFYEYIMAANTTGIVSGFPDGTFKPTATTDRGAMSKMIDNARKRVLGEF